MSTGLFIFLLYVGGMLITRGIYEVPGIKETLTDGLEDSQAVLCPFLLVILWPLFLVLFIFVSFFSFILPGDDIYDDEEEDVQTHQDI